MFLQIKKGYEQWIKEENRLLSRERKFGGWWGLYERKFPWWGISWIKKTGELYAVRIDTLYEFIILGIFETKEDVENRMSGYYESSDNMVIAKWFALEFAKNDIDIENLELPEGGTSAYEPASNES